MQDQPSGRYRILLAAPLDASAEARLESMAEIVRPAGADLCTSVQGCDAIIGRTHTRITRALMAAGAPQLRVVGVAGVGTDCVDVAAAAELGVQVISTPAAASDAVAEFTIGLMLELLRPIRRLASEYARGEFEAARRTPHGDELRGLCVGIIGMGRIGSRVARLCSAGFEARVLYTDIQQVGPFPFVAEPVDPARLRAECDIISLHTPLTEQTRGMVTLDWLRQCRRSAAIINTARGGIIDTDGLTEALRSDIIAGAALDVTDPEPLPPHHPLFSIPGCILTPHVAARTHTGLRNMYRVVDLVIDALRSR